jgi:hypothetical protein
LLSADDQRALCGADAVRHQRTVGQLADAHRDVDALLDKIDEAVIQAQVHAHARMRCEERFHQRQQLQAAKAHRRGQAQPARELLLALAQRALGLGDFGDEPARLLEVALALFGQRQ